MTEEKTTNPQDNQQTFQDEQTGFLPIKDPADNIQKPSLMLHSCCGPCSTVAVERLTGEFKINVFFYNPCITDEEEYKRRRQSQIDFINQYNESFPPKEQIHFMEGPYDPKNYLKATKGLEGEPEGGKRCRECFLMRLEKAAEAANLAGCDYFGTTLTVSPHKNSEILGRVGQSLALKYGLSFVDRDLKKQNGYQRSVELSRHYNLYRQDYCGCEYSKK